MIALFQSEKSDDLVDDKLITKKYINPRAAANEEGHNGRRNKRYM